MILVCSSCGESKDETAFCKCSARKTGRQFYCKKCQSVSSLARYHAKLSGNTELQLKKAIYDKRRRAEDGDKLREYDRVRAKLPHRVALKRNWSRKRKMSVKQATPGWANKDKILSVYESAVVLSRKFNVTYEVDHIVPLHGENVCGLHVENNLCVMEASLNRAKGNGHYPL
ncbi:MAG: hypothetical protein COA78_20225 [Blastopirellula sp.]|nr:MAG: hypothetical protein COA78_20225 [Blastopirellula sp.]